MIMSIASINTHGIFVCVNTVLISLGLIPQREVLGLHGKQFWGWLWYFMLLPAMNKSYSCFKYLKRKG